MHMNLNLIKTEKPKKKKYRATNKHESEQIICPECGGSQFFEIHNCPERKNMKLLKRSGFKSYACLTCYTLDNKVTEVYRD